ncbi:cupin domain-containing protein [Clostridium sp.]|uniref:cupin domain-containing protein n=1 Tax=Clostridium sp. TaxID=1506 RepID=UPI00399613C2
MKTADYFINKLQMLPHVEGGFYKEIISSEESIKTSNNEEKKLFSSIYFLLRTGEVSHFHQLTADEMWYYHAGSALTIYMISPSGELITKNLGLDIEKGEQPQILVPKGYIFGSTLINEGFSLVGCMVAPAFTFDDFKLFSQEDLLKKYPKYRDIILKLSK